MDLLLHFKVNEGDENNINIQEYMLYGDVETKSEKCLVDEGIVIKLKTPLRTINVDSVNPVGRVNFNRMYKRINDIRYSLNKTIETIQNYEGNLKIAKEMVNKPFELQDELTSARNRQKEINKILDTSGNENSKVVVEDDLEEERNESCMEL